MRRKSVVVDQEKLARVAGLLGAKTEAEAIDRALDEVLARDEFIAGLRKLSGRGYEIENLFDPHLEI